jgi:predicted transcriptional regulator
MATATDGRGRRPWGGLEDDVLAALWAATEPMTANAVQSELGGDLAYGTITTILGRLRAKGLVLRTQVGRTYVYQPAQDAASHTAGRMHSLLVGRANRAEVLARFVSALSPEEERVLQDVLREVTEATDESASRYEAAEAPGVSSTTGEVAIPRGRIGAEGPDWPPAQASDAAPAER